MKHCFQTTSKDQYWFSGHVTYYVTCVPVGVILLLHVTLTQGYEIETQDGSNSKLHSLLQKMILGQHHIPRRNLATDWTEQNTDTLYADDDYFFSEPYEGLIYTKRKEPTLSEEYDSVQHTSSSVKDTRGRNKEAVVDLLVLVDNGVYQEYLQRYDGNKKKAVKSIKRYYTLLVHMIDSRYREIDSTEFSLRITPMAVMVVEDPSAFQWEKGSLRSWNNPESETETVMDPHKALGYLHNWIQTHRTLPEYDHVMAFTKYNLVKPGKSRATSGMAYISTMCQTDVGFSVSVISEKGGFANVETATHELAHSLGATHDGGPGNEECPAMDGHIMAPAQALKEHYGPNYFTFSLCSIQAFQKMLESSQASCLYDSEPIKSSSKLPGDFFSPDKQCRHLFGPLSGECKVPGIQKEELICQNLWCKDPNDKYGCITRSGLHAVYGTACETDKICYNGNCVAEDTIKPYEDRLNLQDSHNEHVDVKEILKGQRYPSNSKTMEVEKNILIKDSNERDISLDTEDIDVTDEYLQNAEIHKEDQNEGKASIELSNVKSDVESKPKESSVEHSAKARMPHPGDRRYLAHSGKTKGGGGGSRHRVPRPGVTVVPIEKETPLPTTTTPTSTATIPTAAPCTKDKSSSYCRSLIYTNGVRICQMDSLADYCCFSCSFYG